MVLIPGDPSGAYRLADQLTGLAEVTADAARALSRVEVDWTGGAGTAFVETFALQPRVLKDAAAAFDAGAAALTRYAVDLIAARGEAQVAIDWWRQGMAEAHAAQDSPADLRTSFAARTWRPCTLAPGLATQRAAASKLDDAYAALDRAGHAAADALVAAQAHAPAAATWWETAAPTAYGLIGVGDTPTKREFALGAGRGVIDLFLVNGDRRVLTTVNARLDAWSKDHGLNPDSAATGWGKLAGAMLIPIPGEGQLAGISSTVAASLTRKAANATLKTVLRGLDKTPNLIGRRTITPDGLGTIGVSGILPNSGPIGRSLGAASRPELVARRLRLNPDSPTTRQVLNSLSMPVEDFVAQYRLGSIWGRLGSEIRGMTVEEAIQSSSTARKLLIDGRFAK